MIGVDKNEGGGPRRRKPLSAKDLRRLNFFGIRRILLKITLDNDDKYSIMDDIQHPNQSLLAVKSEKGRQVKGGHCAPLCRGGMASRPAVFSKAAESMN